MREDLVIHAESLARFEREHGLFRRVAPSVAQGYDWEGFYGALILRIFRHGLPETQADLVAEMQEWFIANSANGDAPDGPRILNSYNRSSVKYL